jgi:hypothetical protein
VAPAEDALLVQTNTEITTPQHPWVSTRIAPTPNIITRKELKEMSQIPTPPQSRGASTEPNDEKIDITTTTLDEKVQLLDALLERYLYLLDTHQKLQESLGKQLSSVSTSSPLLRQSTA